MNSCLCGNLTNGNGTMCPRCAALHELGLNAGATDAEVKTAYRLHVKAWHPDRFPGDEKSKNAAQEKLKTINSAYEFLTSQSSPKGQSYRSQNAAPRAEPRDDAHQKQAASEQPPSAGGHSQERPSRANATGQAPPQPPNPPPPAGRHWGWLKYLAPTLLLATFTAWRLFAPKLQTNRKQVDIPKLTTNATTTDNPSRKVNISPEDLNRYYAVYKDRDVRFLRILFNDYLARGGGQAVDIDQANAFILLDGWDKSYYKSKFIVLGFDKGLMGGSSFNILFQDNPDRVFNVWVYTT